MKQVNLNTRAGQQKFIRGLTAFQLYEPLGYFEREIEKLTQKRAAEPDEHRRGALTYWLETCQHNAEIIRAAQALIYEENNDINADLTGPTLVTNEEAKCSV
jgi:hypothetical protein